MIRYPPRLLEIWKMMPIFVPLSEIVRRSNRCCSSVVEHFLGKEEVTSSILVNSSSYLWRTHRCRRLEIKKDTRIGSRVSFCFSIRYETILFQKQFRRRPATATPFPDSNISFSFHHNQVHYTIRYQVCSLRTSFTFPKTYVKVLRLFFTFPKTYVKVVVALNLNYATYGIYSFKWIRIVILTMIDQQLG